MIVGTAWNRRADGPGEPEFIEPMPAKASTDPDQFAAQAYTGVYILAEAIKLGAARATEDTKLAVAMIKDLDTPLGKFSFRPTATQRKPACSRSKGGKFADPRRRKFQVLQ